MSPIYFLQSLSAHIAPNVIHSAVAPVVASLQLSQ
jgi:hypothetical protein